MGDGLELMEWLVEALVTVQERVCVEFTIIQHSGTPEITAQQNCTVVPYLTSTTIYDLVSVFIPGQCGGDASDPTFLVTLLKEMPLWVVKANTLYTVHYTTLRC